MKKLIIIIFALMLLLCACSVPAGSTNIDYGSFDGYYSDLAYEVVGDDDAVTEKLFVLYSDKEMEHAVGMKDVFFDGGDMTRYTVSIGIDDTEQFVTYTSSEDSSYYSVMYFEGGVLTRTEWESEYLDENGDDIRSEGYEEYYSDGRTAKTSREEIYRKGKLESTTTREYAEDGELTSETVE